MSSLTLTGIANFKFQVPWTELWVPDIAFYNGVGESEYVLHENMNRAIVYSSGSILWAPQIHFQTSCSAKEKDQVQVQFATQGAYHVHGSQITY